MREPSPALQETVALLEAILEASPEAILVVDPSNRIVRCTRNYLTLFGVTLQELEARGMPALEDGFDRQVDDADRLAASGRQTWVDDESPPVQELVRFRDGRVFQRCITPFRIGGRVAGRAISYHDVSGVARTMAALEQRRAFLEKAQEVAHIGSWVWEMTGSDAIAGTAETYRIFGLEQPREPRTDRFFSFVHPEDLPAVRQAIDEAIGGAGAYDLQHRILRRDGEVRWVHERAEILRDEQGRPLRMVGTVQDVTDRRRLEEQLRSAQRLEAIGRLAGGVAHDLNNALTAIAGYTELALGLIHAGHPAYPDVEEIRRAAERAESVTRQLLAFSRRQLVTPRVFPLQDSLAALRRLLERLIGDHIALRIDIEPGLPPIHGDPGQIEQAIVNLAANARDAMPDGGRLAIRASVVEVSEAFARVHQPLRAGRYVELSVSDTGHGMAPEVQAQVFDPFFTTKDVGKGTGLGLAMVYGTVQQSGGVVIVESEQGRGTTFRVYLPPVLQRDGGGAADIAGGATIMVVDDEAAVRDLVLAALEPEGYRLLAAASGEEAIELAGRDPRTIDLLLTDVSMPRTSGVALATYLVGRHPGMRLVVMSGCTSSDIAVPGLTSPTAFLQKPFTPSELRVKIREALARKVREL